MPVTSLRYNVNHSPKSDCHQNAFSDVVTDDTDKFLDELTRQKKRQCDIFESIIYKFQNIEESGLKIKLSEIPDERRRTKSESDVSFIEKDSYDEEKKKSASITEVSEIPDFSDAVINSTKKESESVNITEGLEIPDISTAGSSSAKKKSKPANIAKVPYIPDLPIAVNSGRKEREGTGNQKRGRKRKLDCFTEELDTPDLRDAFLNSDLLTKQQSSEQQMERFKSFMEKTMETAVNTFLQFDREIEERQSKEIQKFREKMLALEKEKVELSKSLDLLARQQSPEQQKERFKSVIEKTMETAVNKFLQFEREIEERQSKEIKKFREKVLALEKEELELSKSLDLLTTQRSSEQQKERFQSFIEKAMETVVNKFFQFEREIEERQSKEMKKFREKVLALEKEELELSKSLAQRKSKPANITKMHETPDLSAASINSAERKKSRHSSHTEENEATVSDSEWNVDNISLGEGMHGNQSVKKTRFKKGLVPFSPLKRLKKHPSKDSDINMLIDSAVSMEIPVKYSNENNLLEVNKESVFSLAKSWNSSSRFKKYLWHGVVPICSLSRSPRLQDQH